MPEQRSSKRDAFEPRLGAQLGDGDSLEINGMTSDREV
jgi:hypothetical protein